MKTAVGREGVRVADPLNGVRSLLGSHLHEIDDRATLYGVTLVGEDDAALEARRTPWDRSLTGDLDPERAATAAAWDARIERIYNEYAVAQEEYLVAAGRTTDLPEEEREGAQDELERTQFYVDNHLDLWTEPVDAISYRDGWMRDHGDALAQRIAHNRELAIREALRDRPPEERRYQRLGEGWEYKEIGTGDGAELVERRLAAETELGEQRGWPGHARQVGRDEVEHPPLLANLQRSLGERRTAELRERMEPLAEWVASESSEWVRARHEALGPAPENPHRKAAPLVLRLEQLSGMAIGERTQAEENANRFRASDPDRVAAELRTADQIQTRIDSYAAQLEEQRAEGVDLDRWVADNEDKLIRAAVYEREAEIRRRMDVAQNVERSLVRPSKHVLERLGSAPERGTPEHEQWGRLVRESETVRLERESTQRAGLEPPDVDPRVEQELAERVADYRADQGMDAPEPDANRLALEAGQSASDPGYGY